MVPDQKNDSESLLVSVNNNNESLELNNLDMSNLNPRIQPNILTNLPASNDNVADNLSINDMPDDVYNSRNTTIYQFSSSAMSWKGYIVVGVISLLLLLFLYFLYKKLSN